MPFKDTHEGTTHYYGDNCVPPHVPPTDESQKDLDTLRESEKENLRLDAKPVFVASKTPDQVKQEILEEFSRFYGHSELVSVEDVEHDHGVEYVSDALDRMAEAVREENRIGIV